MQGILQVTQIQEQSAQIHDLNSLFTSLKQQFSNPDSYYCNVQTGVNGLDLNPEQIQNYARFFYTTLTLGCAPLGWVSTDYQQRFTLCDIPNFTDPKNLVSLTHYLHKRSKDTYAQRMECLNQIDENDERYRKILASYYKNPKTQIDCHILGSTNENYQANAGLLWSRYSRNYPIYMPNYSLSLSIVNTFGDIQPIQTPTSDQMFATLDRNELSNILSPFGFNLCALF